jgi:hypothetical protein
MLYFVSGTELNTEYCKENNLYENVELNKDVSKKGYLSTKSRVKAIKLKGEISDGMIMPLETVSKELKEGDMFTHIDEKMICKKYQPFEEKVNLTKKEKNNKNKLSKYLVDKQLKFHFETPHYNRNIEKLKENKQMIVTRKYHGSSFIVANILCKKHFNFIEKFINLFFNFISKEYKIVYSSGKPKSQLPKGIEGLFLNKNSSFYSDDIWKKASDILKPFLQKGMSIYGEIIGKGIQGEEYTYNREYVLKIYRITLTNEDGYTNELSWEDVKKFCNKYELEHVDEYYQGIPISLEELQEKYLNKSYPDCKIDEGICIRNEHHEIYKLKSPNFLKYETDLDEKVTL